MPRPLRLLIARLLAEIAKTTQALENGTIAVDAWRAGMERLLTRYHRAALLAGLGSETIPPKGDAYLKKFVGAQLDFLRNFAIEIAEGDAWRPAYNARAALYSGAIRAPYYAGVTRMLPLPALPGDGSSQCLGACGCSWDIVWHDQDKGDADAYWRRGKNDSCQTCKQRETDWSPLEIRSGELQ